PLLMNHGRFLHNFLEDEFMPAPGMTTSATLSEVPVYRVSEVINRRIASLADVTGCGLRDLAIATYIDCVLCCCWSLNAAMQQAGNQDVARIARLMAEESTMLVRTEACLAALREQL
ncbi:MAG: hypothetical protein KDI36_18370, partial [Pseudomonadales bacterium]|nr:hypothetical protein [Pseudomonadales bacterium]